MAWPQLAVRQVALVDRPGFTSVDAHSTFAPMITEKTRSDLAKRVSRHTPDTTKGSKQSFVRAAFPGSSKK